MDSCKLPLIVWIFLILNHLEIEWKNKSNENELPIKGSLFCSVRIFHGKIGTIN